MHLCVCLCVCVFVYVRQRQSECLCIWVSGGGRAIICSKLLAGRGEVGETVIQRKSKGRREWGGRRTSKEEISWQERKKIEKERKNEEGEREGEVEVSWEQRGFAQLTDVLLYPLSSLLSHPLSCPALRVTATHLIPLTFTMLPPPSSDAGLAAATVNIHNGLRWRRDGGWCR